MVIFSVSLCSIGFLQWSPSERTTGGELGLLPGLLWHLHLNVQREAAGGDVHGGGLPSLAPFLWILQSTFSALNRRKTPGREGVSQPAL